MSHQTLKPFFILKTIDALEPMITAATILIAFISKVDCFYIPSQQFTAKKASFSRISPAVPLNYALADFNDESDTNCVHHASITEGNSAKAIKLRKQVQAIRNEPANASPIILCGPKGSGKTELAEEIVSSLPSWQRQTVHRLSMEDGLHFVDTLLGNVEHPGLFDDLAVQLNTTLILMGFQFQHADSKETFDCRGALTKVLDMLVQGQFLSTYENTTKLFLPKVVLCTRQPPEYFVERLREKVEPTIIKVPSFETRKADIEAIAEAKIAEFESYFALSNVQLSKEATHRLLDHKWELGDDELDCELYNSLEQLALEKKWNPFTENMIKSRHVLVNAYDEKIRIRLLYDIPFLRQIINSPWIFGKTLNKIVIPVFVMLNLILFLGPQTREENAALTIFWAGWWPGIMLVGDAALHAYARLFLFFLIQTSFLS